MGTEDVQLTIMLNVTR